MVEATKNKPIVLLLPKSMQADEQGWAAKFSTADYPVKVTTSKNFAKKCCGLIVYAVTADAEGTEECAKVHKSTYANVPAVVSMADGAAFNTTELLGKIAEARASIEQVFKSFDNDNSGFIDRPELKQAIAKIGIEMNDMDVYNMMLDLDRNKDGKISLEEFQLWWMSGRQGATGTMSRLMEAATRKGSKFADIPNLSTLVGEVPEVTTRANNCEISFNKGKMMGKDDNAITSSFTQITVGPKAREMGVKLMGQLNPDQTAEDPTNNYIKYTLKLKEGITDDMFGEGGFVAFFDKIKAMAPVPLSLTYADGAYTFGVSSPSPPGIVPEFVAELVNKIPANQTIEYMFQMGATPREVLQGLGDGKDPLAFIQQGLALRTTVNVWDGIVQSIVKMISPEAEEEVNPMLAAMLMPMLPAYMMQVRGCLSVDVDEEAVAEIWDTVKELAPEPIKEKINMTNAQVRESLTDIEMIKRNEPSLFAGKSTLDAINMSPGAWDYIPGHENVKTEAEAIKLISSFWMNAAEMILGGNEPETKEPQEQQMISCMATFLGMIFGDEMQMEQFSCPYEAFYDQTQGKVCWADTGIPIATKATIRMEGVAELMTLGGFNVAANWIKRSQVHTEQPIITRRQ